MMETFRGISYMLTENIRPTAHYFARTKIRRIPSFRQKPVSRASAIPPQKIDLIITDVDGTLLDPQQRLTPRVQAAVSAAARINIPLVIATGKAIGPWTHSILPQLDTAMPQIFLQGLLIRDKGEIIYSRELEPELFKDAIDFAKQHNLTLTAYACGDRIVCERTDSQSDRLIFYGEPVPEGIGPLENHVGNAELPVYKVIFMGEEQRIKDIRPAATKLFHNKGSLTTAIPGMLEVLPLGASKGAGVKYLLEKVLNIDPQQCMALGDGENDVEMLELVGFGVAVGNAAPAAMAVADVVVGKNSEDGVAEAIEKFVLEPRGASYLLNSSKP